MCLTTLNVVSLVTAILCAIVALLLVTALACAETTQLIVLRLDAPYKVKRTKIKTLQWLIPDGICYEDATGSHCIQGSENIIWLTGSNRTPDAEIIKRYQFIWK